MRPSDEQYLTTEEVALLFRTTRHAIDSMVTSGKLPFTKPGKRRLFPKTEIDKLLKDKTHEAI